MHFSTKATLVAAAVVALVAFGSVASPVQAQTETPNGTATTAVSTADSPDSGSTPVASTMPNTSTPNGTATTAASTADSPDSGSTPVGTSTPISTPTRTAPTATPTPDSTDSGSAAVEVSTNSSDQGAPLVDRLTGDACDTPLSLDNHTVVCSASMVGDDRAQLIFRSDRPQRVTITDVGGLMTEGSVYQDSHHLSDGKSRVRVPVTVSNGFAGVSVDTGRALHGVPVERTSSLIGGPYDRQDVQTAAVSGAASVAVVSVFVVLRTLTGRADGPERVA